MSSRPSANSILNPSNIPASRLSLNASTANTCCPGPSNNPISYSVILRQSLPVPNSRPSKSKRYPLSTPMCNWALVTVAPLGISNERHKRQVCLSKVLGAQIQEPTPQVGSNTFTGSSLAGGSASSSSSSDCATAASPIQPAKSNTTHRAAKRSGRNRHPKMRRISPSRPLDGDSTQSLMEFNMGLDDCLDDFGRHPCQLQIQFPPDWGISPGWGMEIHLQNW